MFTGIVEELGTVVAVDPHGDSARLTVRGPLVSSDAIHGASIAVNGVCLTVTEHDAEQFTVDVMAETLARTSLGGLTPGAPVNLERAMSATARFGGHIVQGHVDATATITAREPGDHWEVVRFAVDPSLSRYIVSKGSITLDGVSLTVVDTEPAGLSVSLIPTTMVLTTLGRKGVGELVNVEVDILAKYVERLVAAQTSTSPMPPAVAAPKESS
ncbi:MAG: riboflavin synthase [Nostocoides sp.]